MRHLTIRVESTRQFFDRSRAAARRIDAGEGYQGESHSFETLPLLLQTFSPKRWELVLKLQEIGPLTLRALARAVERDVKRVHEDVAVLINEHVVERTEDNKLYVPFATIRFEAEFKTPSAAA